MTMPRWPVLVMAALGAVVALLAGCATAPPQAAVQGDDPQRHIVIAVDNPLAALPGRAGASIAGYGPAARYQQGQQAAATLAALAAEHGLRPVAGWPITALGWQCVLYALPADAPPGARDALLAALAADPRVRLAQPLQTFETHATPAAPGVTYNDPYLPLQHAFTTLAAAEAHRTSAGAGVRVAVIDTGAATNHPDLQGRIARTRDFVGPAAGFEADRHGTQVAGVIAAAGNNHQGIVGIAPLATLELHKACWQRPEAPAGTARCNSFTLAQALATVLAGDARIVNLSLGGPADPLLDRLLAELLKQGRIVVAALPPSGVRGGFPTGTPGVIAAGIAGLAPSAEGGDVVLAPGQDVLTLQPGGGYDYATGSSLAAAHVSAVAALLLAAEPGLEAARLQALLLAGRGGSAPVSAAAALLALRQAGGPVAARR